MAIRVITGATTGIGAALRELYSAQGDTVINIDLTGGDINADLATAEGRASAIATLNERCPDGIQSFAAVAGVGTHCPGALIASLNYFGAQQMTEAVLALLVKGRGHAVVVSSNSAAMGLVNNDLLAAMRAGDETRARELAADIDGATNYGTSKLALATWARKQAVAWAAQGVRLNVVAPGATDTPLLQAGLNDATWGESIRQLPVPLGGFGKPEHIAQAMAFLLSEQAAFIVGSVLFVDGGTDCLIRPQQF